jgi:transposase
MKNNPKIHVINTDEYRSTVLCSNCYTKMDISKSPHRFASCPHCKKVWNRDINAAVNILNSGFNLFVNIDPIIQFSRGFIL